jgi:hypothetical protein
VSYFRPWFLWPETKKLVIPFLRIYLIASLLSVHCVSPHWRFDKPRRISTLKTKYHLLWLPHWPQPIVEYGSSIQGRSMVPTLKISSISPKEKYFRYLPYLYQLFARGRATSKHGGWGRYNAILEFKGSKLKKIDEKEKEKNEKNKERTKIWVWEKEKKKMSMYDIKIK